MKKLLFMIAAAGVLFTACNKACEHNFIEYDYSEDIVGTWTYVTEDGLAEAMVINPDGSFAITGISGVGSLYEEKGTIKVVNNKITLAYNSGDVFEGRLELVAGKSMSIVFNKEYDVCLTYDYCENDLSDDIIGMWVSNDGIENDMVINTFDENGKSYITTFLADENDYVVNMDGDYKVVGNLMIKTVKGDSDTPASYIVIGLDYMPNGTELGDIITMYLPAYGATTTFLRIKQGLNLTDHTYDYISAYVTNAKGKDEDFTILGNIFNISKINSNNFDMFFRSVLSCIEVNDNAIKFTFKNDDRDSVFNDPITVEGNKVTVDMSATNPACRKVDMYMFQDKDDTQLHIYMHTASFVNYFANLKVLTMPLEGNFDLSDAAVEKVFTDMEARVESINVSFVFKARK